MPHIAKTYALQAGLRLSKPTFPIKFFPVNFDKYITICTSSGMNSKNYDLYNDVIELIKDQLDKLGLKIVQVGLQNDYPIRNALDLRGKTSQNQFAYVIKNSALFIGNDSFGCHLAALFDIPCVCSYSVNYKELSKPYWGDPKKMVLLESHKNGNKPSFNTEEQPKTINLIKPEEIAQSALNLLKIDHKLNIKTFYMGNLYQNTEVNLIPDQIVRPDFAPQMVFNVRLDLGGIPENAFQQVSLAKSVLFLNKIVDIEILKQLKPNLAQIILMDGSIDSPAFVKTIKKLGTPLAMVTSKEDQILNDMKLAYCDLGLIQNFPKFSLEKADFIAKLDTNNTFIKSNRLFLSNNKVYASKEHYLAGIECQLQNTESKVINTTEFWQNNLENVWCYIKE